MEKKSSSDFSHNPFFLRNYTTNFYSLFFMGGAKFLFHYYSTLFTKFYSFLSFFLSHSFSSSLCTYLLTYLLPSFLPSLFPFFFLYISSCLSASLSFFPSVFFLLVSFSSLFSSFSVFSTWFSLMKTRELYLFFLFLGLSLNSSSAKDRRKEILWNGLRTKFLFENNFKNLNQISGPLLQRLWKLWKIKSEFEILST